MEGFDSGRRNMEKNVLVVCDLEVEYAAQLSEFLSIKRNVPFEVFAFTIVDRFVDFVSKNSIDVLLISKEALENLKTVVMEMKVNEVFILNDDGDIAQVQGYKSIYKYQNTENILREVMTYYADSEIRVASRVQVVEDIDMIAVYSPVKRSLKTSFAMTLGQILSENRRVLYINLEDYSGFNQLMKMSYMTDMSDLLYYISQGKPNFIWKMSSIVQSLGNLDYIPPAISPMDIKNVTVDEWIMFFKELKKCEYETVILDIGDSVNGIYDILRMCRRIYMPTRDDSVSFAKMEQYEALMKIMEYEDVLKKTRKLSFSYFKGIDGNFDRLVYSELGAYIRSLLKTDGVY